MRRYFTERGSVLPLVALSLAVIMGFAGMGVDVGFLEYQQRQQQNAADGAAVGAAQQLLYSGCPNQTVAQSTADGDSSENGFTSTGNVTVTANNPPTSGPFSSDNCAVMVTVNNSAAQTFFTRLFGYASGMPVTTSAVATSSSNGNGCVYLLDPNGTPDFHGAKISAPGCGLLINGSPTFDGGDIDFSYIGYAGGSDTVHGTKWEDASPTSMLRVADPCAEISGCAYLANNPPSATSCGPLQVTGTSVQPGCYSSISGNGTFTLEPGLYVLTGTNSLNGATINGSGVTLYVTSTGSGIDFHGTKVNLSACTTSCSGGAVANVLYYQVPANSSAMNIAGPDGSYSGLIYAPSASVTYDGNAGTGYTVMVFYDWVLNGTGQGMAIASPPPNGSLVKKIILVQ